MNGGKSALDSGCRAGMTALAPIRLILDCWALTPGNNICIVSDTLDKVKVMDSRVSPPGNDRIAASRNNNAGLFLFKGDITIYGRNWN